MYNITNLAVNETITIPLIAGGANSINWGSLEFVPTGSQSLSGTTLVTTNGEADFVGESIVYTLLDATPTGEADLIQFRVSDSLGNQSAIASACVTFNTLPAPVAATMEVCSVCYSSTPYFNVGDYATGPYVSAEVVTPPVSGTLTQSGTSFSYTQDAATFDAIDGFTYKLVDANGVDSNTATVYIRRSCLGYPINTISDITCLPKIFDLFDFLSLDTYINPGTWEETTQTTTYASQGGVITGGQNGTVDFTSIVPGTYTFRYYGTLPSSGAYPTSTVNCPIDLETTITILHTATPAITYTTNTLLSGTNYQVNFTLANVTNPSTITVTNNAVPVTSFVINPQISGSNGFFVITLGAGANALIISALTTCNTTVTTNTTITV